MNINPLLKGLPLNVLGQVLRVFRFSTRAYEQVQSEYYSRLSDHGASLRTQDFALSAEEMTPVFVLSTGRCGTKTLAALGELMSAVDAHHEPEPKLLEASYLYYMNSCPHASEDFWQGLLAGNRDEMMRHAGRSEKIYFETNNRLALLGELLISRYPKAKFVHVVRHPCDFVRSAMRRNYYNNHPWDFARISPRPDEPDSEIWNEFGQLEKCAWLWSKTNSHIDRLLRGVSATRILFMRSEDIFNNIENSAETLLAFSGGKKNVPKVEKIEKVLGMKLNQQTYGKFPKAGDWLEEEKQILGRHCRTLMEAYGYDF